MANPPFVKPGTPTNQVVCNDQGVDRSGSRREFERVACATPARVFEITPENGVLAECPALVQDLSKCGIGLRSRKLFAVGGRVVLLLSAKSGEPRPYFGIVRQSRYTGKSMYSVGIEFIPPVQSESITRWMIEQCGKR
jgi:hypothetical protein